MPGMIMSDAVLSLAMAQPLHLVGRQNRSPALPAVLAAYSVNKQ